MQIYDNVYATQLRKNFLRALDRLRTTEAWIEAQEFASEAIKLVGYTQQDLWEEDKVDTLLFSGKACPECEECDEFSIETPVLIDINYSGEAKLNMFSRITEIDKEAIVRCSNCLHEAPWWVYDEKVEVENE